MDWKIGPINTIHNILNRHGLTKKRKRRPGVHRVRPEHTQPRPNKCGALILKDGSIWEMVPAVIH